MCHKAYSYFLGTTLWLLLQVKVWSSSLKFLPRWSITKKLSWSSNFELLSTFSLFWFPLKQILASERKRLSCHRLVSFFSLLLQNLKFYKFTKLWGIFFFQNIGLPQVLEFLEFRELFWIFFYTRNVLEEGHPIRIVLEMFLNLESFVRFFFAQFLKIFLDMHIKRLRFRNQFGFLKPILHSC